MQMTNGDRLERVSILGGVRLTLEAMNLYCTIAQDVLKIDEKLRKINEQGNQK